MSMLSLSLVVLAAFIHATWNLLAKRASNAGPFFVLVYTAFSVLLYAPWFVWLLIDGSLDWTLPVVLCVLASGVLHLAYSLFLQRGYQVADLSVVYPVARGSAPVVSTLGAVLLFGESLPAVRVLGLACVVLGILLIATHGRIMKFREPAAAVGVKWGGLTGAMIASYTVVDAYGVKLLGIHPVILDWCANLVRLVMLLPWAIRNRAQAGEKMRGKWGLAVAVGALSPLSYILVLLALRLGAPVSFVAPAREMSMMVGALFGMLLLGERVGLWRLVGCAVLIAGVVLLGQG